MNREACRVARDSRIPLAHVSLVEKLDDVLNRRCLESTAIAGTCGNNETVYRPRSPQLTQVNASVRAIDPREDDGERSDSDSNSSSDDKYCDYENEVEVEDDESNTESALARTPSHQLLYRDFIQGLSKSNLRIFEHLLNPAMPVYSTWNVGF